MITNQHLAFNPKRPNRTEKHTRHGLQLKYKGSHQQQSIVSSVNHPEPTHQHSKKDSRVEQKYNHRPQEKDTSYELGRSKFSNREYQDQQSEKKKEELMLRVKKLQNIVMPLVDGGQDDEDKHEVGWQARIQRKIIRIQNSLDNVKKEWELEMQKKIIEMEEQFEARYDRLKNRIA